MKAVNLLPPDLRKAPKAPAAHAATVDRGSGTGAFVVLGVLAFAVAALAGYIVTGNTIKQREAELAELDVREQTANAQAARLKPFADFDALASARVTTVRDLAGRRFDWEQSLRDLSRALPGNVTLTALTGSVSPGSGGGSGGSSLRGAVEAPAISIAGCTTGQKAVAGLMARLRTVEGVTRVSLSKSEKKQTSGGGPAPAGPAPDGAAPVSTDPCGERALPSFEMVAFFEDAAAASEDPTAAPVSTPAEAPAEGADGAEGTAEATASDGAEAATTPASTTQEEVTP